MKKWWPRIWFGFWYGASCVPSALAICLSPKLLPVASLFGWTIWVGAIAVMKKARKNDKKLNE